MPVLQDTADEPLPPALPPALMVLTVAAVGAFVYLSYHSMRGETAWGMAGETLRLAALAAAAVLFASMAYGAWLVRRRRAKTR